MSNSLISALIISATLALDLITDLRQWGRINHIRGAWLRVPSFIAATIVCWYSVPLWLSYWFVFDSVIGMVKYGNWLALGTTSRLDLLQKRRHRWLQWVKIGGGAGAIIIYILL